MIKEIKNHTVAYIILVAALLGFVVIFLHVWPDINMQRIVAVAMGLFYFLWGIVVHKRHNHINARVIFEYLAISVLAVSLLLLLLN